jgi:adenine deaminase
MDADKRKEIINVSLGKESADIAILNSGLIDVYSSEILDNINIAIKGDRIAYVGYSTPKTDKDTIVIDAGNSYVSPGFFDPHVHLEFIVGPFSYVDSVLPLGTTSVVVDLYRWGRLFGAKGMLNFAEMVSSFPMHIFCAPTTNFLSDGIELANQLFNHPLVVGMGEHVIWKDILNGEERILEEISFVEKKGKKIEGHTAGVKGDKIDALCNGGLTSCHEPIKAEEVLERLRLGMYVALRHGSIRSDMESLSKAITEYKVDTRRLMFTCDWMNPHDLVKKGHMNWIVKEAIKNGIKPIKAYQMATLNPSEYFGLDHKVGGVSPSKYADILIIDDLKEATPHTVISKGKIITINGKRVMGKVDMNYPDYTKNALNIKRNFLSEEFSLSPDDTNTNKYPCIEYYNGLITKMVNISVDIKEGIAVPKDNDVAIVAMAKRGSNRKPAVGFAKGFSLNCGAFVSSVGLDTQDLFIIGKNKDDMALGANYICKKGGGIAIIDNNRIESFFPLPVAGVLSNLPLKDMAYYWDDIESKLLKFGLKSRPPILSILFLTFTHLPYIRITPEGLFDVLKNEIVGKHF